MKKGDTVVCVCNKNTISDYSKHLTVGKNYTITKVDGIDNVVMIVYVITDLGEEAVFPVIWFKNI